MTIKYVDGRYFYEDNPLEEVDLNKYKGWQREDYEKAGIEFIEPMGAKDSMDKDIEDLFSNPQYYVDEKIDGCFTKDSKVLMSDFTFKDISDVNKGDFVKSYNERLRLLEDKKVLNTFNHGSTDEWIRVTITYGSVTRVIQCTKNHLFYIRGSYVRADSLVEGDLLSIFC